MGQALILIGVGCMIAAIVGGGITLQQLEVSAVPSLWRQGFLGVFGFLVSAFGFGVNQDYFKAPPIKVSAPPDASTNSANSVHTSQSAANTAAPTKANAVRAAANTAGPVDTKALQRFAGKSPKPPAAAKTAANEQAALTMHDQNGLPVVDVSGIWVDESGHKLSFAQEGANVSINGGNESGSSGQWTGRGNAYRKSRIQLDLTEGPGAHEFCRGPTYKTSITLMCENPDTGANVRHTTLRKVR